MHHPYRLMSRRVVALMALVVAMAVAAVSAASASAAFPPGVSKWRITTGATGFTNVLNAAGDFNFNGEPVINWPLTNTTNAQWYIEQISATPGGTPAYQISSVRDPGYCLDVFGASHDNGALVGMWGCNYQMNQQFFYHENSNKTGSFISRESGKALTMPLGTGQQMFQSWNQVPPLATQQFQFYQLH
jgi:hypothetical protein